MSATLEIERKFLVTGTAWKKDAKATPIAQGYIVNAEGLVVRPRIKGEKGFLTIKADRGGISRREFEYEIPSEDAQAMLDELCGGKVISKTRYELAQGDLTWEIDEFHGINDGLLLAEIELKYESQAFDKPVWLGPEVSHDKRFFNAYLFDTPFDSWGIDYDALLLQCVADDIDE